MPELIQTDCQWCRLPVADPEKARLCDCLRHDDEVTYCSRSCMVADHG